MNLYDELSLLHPDRSYTGYDETEKEKEATVKYKKTCNVCGFIWTNTKKKESHCPSCYLNSMNVVIIVHPKQSKFESKK